MSLFGDPYMLQAEALTFSPDRKIFVVETIRGRLDLNRSESTLQFFRMEDVRHIFLRDGSIATPSPYWTISESTYKNGPIITQIRWLADSSAVAFLAKNSSGNDQLFVADIPTKTVDALTSEEQEVTAYDVRSRSRFVYTVASPAIREKAIEESQAAAFPGTGRTFNSLIFSQPYSTPSVWVSDLSELWACIDSRKFRVIDVASGQALPIHLEGQRALALSPDGRSVITAMTIRTIPPEWQALFPPSLPSSPYRIRAGQQDADAFAGQSDVSEYVLIDILSGKAKSLAHAPIGNAAGWWAMTRSDWSADGKSVVLSNTFLKPSAPDSIERPVQPCVAVANIATDQLTCLVRVDGETEKGFEAGTRFIDNATFAPGTSDRVTVDYFERPNWTRGHTTYARARDGIWTADSYVNVSANERYPIDVTIKEDLNHSPVLVATDRATNDDHIILDPNPQLKHVELGEVSVLKWKDKDGRGWFGGLYKPPDYVSGRRYPLVIQTHGFSENEFRPSGAYPTAFAAQELATAGFVVLQVHDCSIRSSPEEGPCQVAGYEAAVAQLSTDGLVDPDRVGIVGFSRTCFYVLQALTVDKMNFKAASITDGVDEGYLQYILDIDIGRDAIAHEANMMIGAIPFGSGLQQWLKRSPEFNMDKVTTPLQVVATRRQLSQMWEPYAALRYLNRPVDLLVLNSDEHVLTNPAARIASQGGTVDWFRFWLKDEEDPDPAKAEQYARWRELRKLQQNQNNAPKN